jgi:UDP-glucose 4-epimerase
MRALITGSSGAIGRRIAAALALDPVCERIVGLDIRQPDEAPANFHFLLRDVRQPIGDVLAEQKIDTLIHCAFLLQPSHNRRLMEETNVGAAATSIRACRESRHLRTIIQLSSATVYGFRPTTRPFTEEDQVMPFPQFAYAEQKARVETMFQHLGAERPDLTLTILRPSLVAGRGDCDPVMRYLRKRVVVLPRSDAKLQIAHVDEIAEAIRRLAIAPLRGTFNVAPADAIRVTDVVEAFGGVSVSLPFQLLKPLNEMAWRCRLKRIAPAPSSALSILNHSWLVDSSKLASCTGFRCRRSSVETLQELASQPRASHGWTASAADLPASSDHTSDRSRFPLPPHA